MPYFLWEYSMHRYSVKEDILRIKVLQTCIISNNILMVHCCLNWSVITEWLLLPELVSHYRMIILSIYSFWCFMIKIVLGGYVIFTINFHLNIFFLSGMLQVRHIFTFVFLTMGGFRFIPCIKGIKFNFYQKQDQTSLQTSQIKTWFIDSMSIIKYLRKLFISIIVT